jgi:phosphatidylserine/phosphatidylglycerophosphate/cardiolipin synthase-like enzyme
LEVLFSPPPGIPARIARAIDAAELSIFVLMYHFTESTLARRMAQAVARGVECRCILDYEASRETNSMARQLARTGVHVFTDAAHTLMHSKYAVIDHATILTGSANWSYNADGAAAEDFLVIGPDPDLAALWLNDWSVHRSHSIALPRS